MIKALKESRYKKSVSPQSNHINIASGKEITIKDLSILIAQCVGFKGDIKFDTSRPDGPKRKLMDGSVLYDLGWRPETKLKQGLIQTYSWFLKNYDESR